MIKRDSQNKEDQNSHAIIYLPEKVWRGGMWVLQWLETFVNDVF